MEGCALALCTEAAVLAVRVILHGRCRSTYKEQGQLGLQLRRQCHSKLLMVFALDRTGHFSNASNT